MSVSNLGNLVSYFIFIILFILSYMFVCDTYTNQIEKTIYKKLQYALDAASNVSLYNVDDESLNNISVNNFENAVVNYKEIYNEFIKFLKLNFEMEVSKNIENYIETFMIIENDFIYLNRENTENKRVWLEKVPYSIEYLGEIYNFKLDSKCEDDDKYKNIETKKFDKIKNMAIVKTIRRNLVYEDELVNKKSILINIPFEDESSNNLSTINNKTIIVTFKNFKIYNMNFKNIISVSANELKRKNMFYINENNRYEKINYGLASSNKNILIFESAKEAGIEYFPEI